MMTMKSCTISNIRMMTMMMNSEHTYTHTQIPFRWLSHVNIHKTFSKEMMLKENEVDAAHK